MITSACSATPPAAESQQAVRDIVESMEESINARDWNSVFSSFGEDADLVVLEGPRLEGRATAQSAMEANWSSVPADVRADLTPVSVRLLTPEVAIAEIEAEFTGSRPSTDRATAVMSLHDGVWMIDAFRIVQPTGVLGMGDGPPDAVSADPAHYSVELENSLVRVLRVTYTPGARSTLHSHPAHCAVFLTGGTFRFTLADGSTTGGDAPTPSGDISCVDADVHTPENVGSQPVELVLIELKGRQTFAP